MDIKGRIEKIKQKLFNKQYIQKIIAPRKIPALAAVILSLIAALAGFTAIAKSYHFAAEFYMYFFLVLGIVFLIEEIRLFLINKRKSIRLLLLVITLLVIASLVTVLPSSINMGEYGFSASLSHHFLLSLALTLFGLIGASLALGAFYDFKPIGNQQSAYLFLIVCILLILYPLVVIIGEVVVNGVPGFSWDFLTKEIDVSSLGAEGGVRQAIIGTLLLMALIFLVAVPLGIGAAIYLEEYAGGHAIVRVIQTAISILRGVPSIVFGLFALAFFAPIFGRTYLTGGLILSVYALPMIIRASSEALKSIPQLLREGSLALGATRWQTIRKVVLPPAAPGIITGMVLGVGEAAGETAPLIFFTTLSIKGLPGLNDMIVSLQTHLFTLFQYLGFGETADKVGRLQSAWSTALVLLIIILSINVIALVIREKYRKEF